MQIVLLTYGSRGDVQPFVALGTGLKRAGFDVRIAAPEGFKDFVEPVGLEFAPLPGDPRELSRMLVDQGGANFIRLSKTIRDFAVPLGVGVYKGMKAACEGADAILYSFLIAIPAHHIARELGVPDFFVQLQPILMPTRSFPSLMMPSSPVLRGAFNWLTHRLFEQIFWQSNRFSYHYVRRQVPHEALPERVIWPLARRSPHRPPVLYAISPAVVPRPNDWPSTAHMTGYWFLDSPADWQPDAALQHFLDDGPPPVYIGFGSMVSKNMEATVHTTLDALKRTGQRGLLVTGWSGVDQTALPDTVMKIDGAPHDWLFPKMAAIVHHGGAGTTAAVLRSGVPGVVVPFFGDQFFWGRRTDHLGTGPEPIPSQRLRADKLALAIHTAATFTPMREQAAQLGATIREEDGVANAIRLITSRLNRQQGA